MGCSRQCLHWWRQKRNEPVLIRDLNAECNSFVRGVSRWWKKKMGRWSFWQQANSWSGKVDVWSYYLKDYCGNICNVAQILILRWCGWPNYTCCICIIHLGQMICVKRRPCECEDETFAVQWGDPCYVSGEMELCRLSDGPVTFSSCLQSKIMIKEICTRA